MVYGDITNKHSYIMLYHTHRICMYAIYGLPFTITIPQMLAYIYIYIHIYPELDILERTSWKHFSASCWHCGDG